MPNDEKRIGEDLVKMFVSLDDYYAEKVVVVNPDGSPIGGGGGGTSDVDVIDRVGRLVGIVTLDSPSLSALEAITAAVSGTIGISGVVEIENDSGNPLPISGSVTISDGSGPVTVDGTVAISGGVAISGNVEVMNDSGNPLPISGSVTISDGSGPVTVDGTVAVTNAIMDPVIATEDLALAGAHKGIPIFFTRRDADTSLVDTDGDAATGQVDSIGRLKVKNIKDTSVVISATVNIANAASLSGTNIDLTTKSLVGISMPAAWTEAGLSFEVSVDGGIVWQPLVDSTNTERTLTVVAAKFITLDPTWFMGAPLLRLRSGTSAVPVNQGASRDFKLTTIVL